MGGKKTKRPEPRPRWRIVRLAHQNPRSAFISWTWQKAPKPLKIGCIGFLQSFVSGRINLHQLFTCALFLGKPVGAACTLGLTLRSLLTQLRGAGVLGREFSLFTHFNAQSIFPRAAPSPPPARAESWDGISANRQCLSDPPSHKQRVLEKRKK